MTPKQWVGRHFDRLVFWGVGVTIFLMLAFAIPAMMAAAKEFKAACEAMGGTTKSESTTLVNSKDGSVSYGSETICIGPDRTRIYP